MVVNKLVETNVCRLFVTFLLHLPGPYRLE